MKITLRRGCPYIIVTLTFRDERVQLENILLDTGSAGSVFATDKLAPVGLKYEPSDPLYTIRGVGGAEFVFVKRIDRLMIDRLSVQDFEIEVGALDYGFEIDGILGMDFLTAVGAVIDLNRMEIRAAIRDDQ